MKLNVGCGMDYREGFVNVDASDALSRVDVMLDLADPAWRERFGEASVERIVAYDFIEHHFHWEAVRLLGDFYWVLQPGGVLEIRLPDAGRILRRWWVSPEKRLRQLYGGQDTPNPSDPEAMAASRREYPQFFCHKYGYTRRTMRAELDRVGFVRVETVPDGGNFRAVATKPA